MTDFSRLWSGQWGRGREVLTRLEREVDYVNVIWRWDGFGGWVDEKCLGRESTRELETPP